MLVERAAAKKAGNDPEVSDEDQTITLERIARHPVHSIVVDGQFVTVYFQLEEGKLANSDVCYRIRNHFLGKAESTILGQAELPLAA